MIDPALKRYLDEIGKEVGALRARVVRAERGSRQSQLKYSAIDQGYLTVIGPDGQVMTIGQQPDNTIAVVQQQAPPPPMPNAATVIPGGLSITVTVDGTFVGGAAQPADFDHFEVHISTEDGFATDAGTLVATLKEAGTVVLLPLEDVIHYVVLVAVNTSGTRSDASPQAFGTPTPVVPPLSITETEIADDSISTPKLQALAVVAENIAANAVIAGKIDVGAVAAENLAAVLAIVTRLVCGDLDANRVEINQDGIFAYDEDENQTFNLSSDDGSITMTGTLNTSLDQSSWSIGQGGAWTVPGESTDDSMTGNPASQIAWQNGGDIRAFIEARIDDTLRLRSIGGIALTPGTGGEVNVRALEPTGGNFRADGLLRGRQAAHRRVGTGGTPTVPSNTYGFVIGVGGTTHGTLIGNGDTGDITWDATTASLVAPWDGLYRLGGSFAWGSLAGTYRYIELFNLTQNSVIAADRRAGFSANAIEQTIYTIMPLAAGDKVQLRVYQTTGSNGGWQNLTDPTQQAPPASLTMEFAGWPTGPTSSNQTALSVVPVFTGTYQYGSVNAWLSGDYATYVYQGSNQNGNTRGMFFYGSGAFDALIGKTIDQVSMYVRRGTTDGDNGAIRPHLCSHTYATKPGGSPTLPSGFQDYGLVGDGYKHGGRGNMILDNQVGEDLASGISKGLMFDSEDGSRYSQWLGVPGTTAGLLTIIYH